MYENQAVMALLIFFYSIVAGFAIGPMVLGWSDRHVTSTELRVIVD